MKNKTKSGRRAKPAVCKVPGSILGEIVLAEYCLMKYIKEIATRLECLEKVRIKLRLIRERIHGGK